MNDLLQSTCRPMAWRSFFASGGKYSSQWSLSANFAISLSSSIPILFIICHWNFADPLKYIKKRGDYSFFLNKFRLANKPVFATALLFFPLDLSLIIGSSLATWVSVSVSSGKTGGNPKSSISLFSLSAQAFIGMPVQCIPKGKRQRFPLIWETECSIITQ